MNKKIILSLPAEHYEFLADAALDRTALERKPCNIQDLIRDLITCEIIVLQSRAKKHGLIKPSP